MRFASSSISVPIALFAPADPNQPPPKAPASPPITPPTAVPTTGTTLPKAAPAAAPAIQPTVPAPTPPAVTSKFFVSCCQEILLAITARQNREWRAAPQT